MSYNGTNAFNKCFNAAYSMAEERGNADMTPVHLAAVLFKDPSSLASRVCNKLNVSNESVYNSLNQELNRLPRQHPVTPQLNHGARAVLTAADKLRTAEHKEHIAIDHLMMAFYEDSKLTGVLNGFQLTKPSVERTLKNMKGNSTQDSKNAEENYEALEKYGINLTQMAEAGKLDKITGREDVLRRMMQVLVRKTKNTPVLTGAAGVGKTAIIELLAQRIVDGDVPTSLKNKVVIALDLGRLIAGASHRGEFEERLKAVVDCCKDNPSIILFIDEFHTLMGAGGSSDSPLDASNLLKPDLARGLIKVIGATTDAEFKQFIAKDRAFSRRLARVDVPQASVEESISILRGLKSKYELHHGVHIKDSALVSAANLASKYLTNRMLPDSAIDLLDEACASIRLTLDSSPAIIDDLQRKKLRFEIELTALQSEKDDRNNDRIAQIQKSIDKVSKELEPLQALYDRERGKLTEINALKQKLDDLRIKIEKAERERNIDRVADLKYYAVPEVEAKIKRLEQEQKQQTRGQEGEELVYTSETVTPDTIAQVLSHSTGIPVGKLTENERSKVLELPKRLAQRVIGQSTAVRVVSDAIIKSRANMGAKNRPIASLLFAGPTGVGKTELAKALAAELFTSEKDIIRVDCSELSEKHSISKLIGTTAGYIGYGEPSIFDKVQHMKYTLILLDEAEKAHPEVWNLFLAILDEGRLTDARGDLIDFTNAVVIFTSNLGSRHITKYSEELKHNSASIKDETSAAWLSTKNSVLTDIKQFFKPEQLNRLDGIVVFNPLSPAVMSDVVKVQLKPMTKQLKEQNIVLDVTDSVIKKIATDGYDPQYGARPVKRLIESSLVLPISKLILQGSLNPGSTVVIESDPEHISQSKGGVAMVDDMDIEDEEITQVASNVFKSCGYIFNVKARARRDSELDEDD